MRTRFVVHGIVQGVFFRTTAADEAQRLRLTGRIWNRTDGAVECVAEGGSDALDRFREWLDHGPRHARVERVESSDVGEPARYSDFQIAREPER